MGWRERAVLVGVAVAAMVLPLAAASSSTTRAASGDGAWVLDEVVVESADDWWAERMDFQTGDAFEWSAAAGSFSVRRTYVGPSSDLSDRPRVHGEGVTFHVSFSEPPSRLVPGDEVSVEVELRVSDDSHSAFTSSVSANVETFFVDAERERAGAGPRLVAADGSTRFGTSAGRDSDRPRGTRRRSRGCCPGWCPSLGRIGGGLCANSCLIAGRCIPTTCTGGMG